MAASPLRLRTFSQPTLVDFAVVESGVQKQLTEGRTRGVAFARYVLSAVFNIPDSEIGDHLVDGASDRGIDIIFIDHSNRRINLCTCKCVAPFDKSARNFPGKEVDKILSLIDDVILKNEGVLVEANGFLAAKIREIWEVFESGDTYKVCVHLFSNQLPLADAERQRLLDRFARYGIDVREHGLYELAHGVVRALKPSFRKKVIPVKNSTYEVTENGHRGWHTRAHLADFVSFLAVATTGEFDERLLTHNVRYFLGLDNSVNKEIRDTLTKGNADDFWLLNNGLTIVCDKMFCVGPGNHSMTLENPRIVNGGQTASVIHDVDNNPLLPLTGGSIAIKIIETSDEQLIERIAVASNTQSRIFGRDLRAFDVLQEKIAHCLSSLGYFYRRKRGERPPNESLVLIDMARVGQLMLAFVAGEPVKSKTDSQEIFGDLYAASFDPSAVTPELVVAAHECHS